MRQMKRRDPLQRVLRWLSVSGGAIVLLGLVYWISLPSAVRLASENPESTAFIEACCREAGRVPRWSWVPSSRISTDLRVAVVAGEDMNFFSHAGYDSYEIKQSLKRAWADKKPPRGASTITQQLARNLWLAPNRSYLRKLRELHLSRRLEKALSKQRILEIYLNVVEFGPGIYGVEAAAQHYFGVSAASISRDQAAALAALLPQPSLADVHSSQRSFQARRRTILARIDQARWLRGLV